MLSNTNITMNEYDSDMSIPTNDQNPAHEYQEDAAALIADYFYDIARGGDPTAISSDCYYSDADTDLTYEQDFEPILKQEGFEIKPNIAPDALSKFAHTDHPLVHMDNPFFDDCLRFDRHSSSQMPQNMGIDPMMKNNLMADYSTSSSEGHDYDVTNNNIEMMKKQL